MAHAPQIAFRIDHPFRTRRREFPVHAGYRSDPAKRAIEHLARRRIVDLLFFSLYHVDQQLHIIDYSRYGDCFP